MITYEEMIYILQNIIFSIDHGETERLQRYLSHLISKQHKDEENGTR